MKDCVTSPKEVCVGSQLILQRTNLAGAKKGFCLLWLKWSLARKWKLYSSSITFWNIWRPCGSTQISLGKCEHGKFQGEISIMWQSNLLSASPSPRKRERAKEKTGTWEKRDWSQVKKKVQLYRPHFETNLCECDRSNFEQCRNLSTFGKVIIITSGHGQTIDNNENCNASYVCMFQASNCIEDQINFRHTLQSKPLTLVRVKRCSICTTRKFAFRRIRPTFDW